MTKIKCFVAMAFGKDDVNYIYKEYIKPTVLQFNMVPRQMEELLHNTRISDQKIISEIRNADILIADLTYARPSVYWEAGFAEGLEIPVIYTVRIDHFRDKEDDLFGNLKVHFDLQNAPIIPWDGKNNKKFQNELKKRIIYISKPIISKLQKSINLEKSMDEFNKLSMAEKKEKVNHTSNIIFSKNKFKLLKEKYWKHISPIYSRKYVNRRKIPLFIYKNGTSFIRIHVDFCADSILQSDLESIRHNIRNSHNSTP